MAVREGTPDIEEFPPTNHEDVRAYSTRPDRVVFVASGQSDAWIASDVTIPVTE